MNRIPDIKPDDKLKRGYITEVNTMKIKDPEEVQSLLNTVIERRDNTHPSSNDRHIVFQINISGRNNLTNESRYGTINIIELPSSDRIASESTKEPILINPNLLPISNVICALANQDKTVPYRASKITQLLQYSLVGGRVMVLLTLAPGAKHYMGSLNVLKFASKLSALEVKKQTKNTK